MTARTGSGPWRWRCSDSRITPSQSNISAWSARDEAETSTTAGLPAAAREAAAAEEEKVEWVRERGKRDGAAREEKERELERLGGKRNMVEAAMDSVKQSREHGVLSMSVQTSSFLQPT
ncbi:2-N-acetylglucosaminyltransferase [Striga asiatica]|uniref:2-N-acetylglucosaminyltransferase n=1 Tax=Striga asiatica TaxID=4170 RepID=A0A5A7QX88_STRAF|nr:2-N-acetylglucosaminyltransferase [Striga asiatica]